MSRASPNVESHCPTSPARAGWASGVAGHGTAMWRLQRHGGCSAGLLNRGPGDRAAWDEARGRPELPWWVGQLPGEASRVTRREAGFWAACGCDCKACSVSPRGGRATQGSVLCPCCRGDTLGIICEQSSWVWQTPWEMPEVESLSKNLQENTIKCS